MDHKLLRIEDVAALTGVAPATLRYWRWRDRGEGPASFRLGRRVVWDAAEVDAWISKQRKQGVNEHRPPA